jgi:MFS family permease
MSDRLWVGLVWIVSVFLTLGLGVVWAWLGWIGWDTFGTLAQSASHVYGPLAGLAIGGLYGCRRGEEHGDRRLFVLAITVSIAWNAILMAPLLALVLREGNVEDAIGALERSNSLLSWSVTGIVGYYFAAAGGGVDNGGVAARTDKKKRR